MSIEDLTDDKELVIVMTEAQYVKAVPAGSFKTQGRGGRGVSGESSNSTTLCVTSFSPPLTRTFCFSQT
jgi:DNA gyrase subunit A